VCAGTLRFAVLSVNANDLRLESAQHRLRGGAGYRTTIALCRFRSVTAAFGAG
jgi:hypothetical protein